MLALAAWILVCSSASALTTNYGAIAYEHATDAWGASYDYPSQQMANERATGLWAA
jgi:hypothetical protein